MRTFLACAALLAAFSLWSRWRVWERAANRTAAYRDLRRPRRIPLSETPAMRRASEWVPE